jgi:PAS domain S-box-containing protein
VGWSWSAYDVALALTALTLAALSVVSWRRRGNTRGARSFTFFMLAAAIWTVFELAQSSDADPARQLMWLQLKFLGITFVPVAFLAFAGDYTRQGGWLNRVTLSLLMVVPVVTVALAWSNPLHGLLWSDVAMAADGLRLERGPWFWVHAAYGYALLALGSIYLLRGYVLTPARYRAQVSLVLVAVLVPWLANVLLVAGVVGLPDVDVTPLAFSLSALLFARSLFSHRLLDIVPIAQETVMRHLSDAVVIVDGRARILQVNPAAASLLGVADPDGLVGANAATLFSGTPEVVAGLAKEHELQFDATVPTVAGTRHFHVHVTPLADRRGRRSGHMVRLHDIERQVQGERTLVRAEAALAQQDRYVRALQDVSDALIARRDLREMLAAVLAHAASVLEAPHGFLDLVDDGALRRVHALGRFGEGRMAVVRFGEGLSGRAWQLGAPVRVDDYAVWPGRLRGVDLSWARGAIAAPLLASGEIVGVLALARDRGDARSFGDASEALLTRFTQLGAIAVENVRLFTEIDTRRRLSEGLNRLVNALQEQSGVQERLDLVLRAVRELALVERGVIWLPDDAGDALETTSWIGFGDECAERLYRVPLDGSVPVLRDAFVHGHEIVLDGPGAVPEQYRAQGSCAELAVVRSRALAALPLVSRGRTVGVLAVDNPRGGAPLAASLPALRQVVASAALAIDTARLHEAVQQELHERTLAEAEVRRSEEKYRRILEQIEDSYFETDLMGRFTLVNPALAAAVQESPERLIGRSFRHYLASDEISGVLKTFNRVAKTGVAVQRREMRYRRPDGTVWHGETSISTIYGDDGTMVGFRGVVRDIEDRKRHEQEREAAKEMAEAANAAKSAFLANVSHELRTPLTSILGFAQLIGRRVDEVLAPVLAEHEDRKVQRAVEQVRGNAQIIHRESQRLTALINGILDLAKIEAGRVEWNMQSLRPGDVVHRALEATAGLLASRPQVRLVTDVDEALPAIVGDHDRLVQVVINLLSNAIKFTPAGDVTVRVHARDAWVRVAVRDTGIGIASEHHDAVFEQFRQVGDTLTEKPQGTGLGLPICKEIVEHHGGRIWVESALGQGSTFAFELPVAAVDTVPEAVAG